MLLIKNETMFHIISAAMDGIMMYVFLLGFVSLLYWFVFVFFFLKTQLDKVFTADSAGYINSAVIAIK